MAEADASASAEQRSSGPAGDDEDDRPDAQAPATKGPQQERKKDKKVNRETDSPFFGRDAPLEQLNKRAMELDRWVCNTHTYLTVGGVAVYSVEFIVGTVLLITEWNEYMNQVIRVFLIMRLFSYLYLTWVSYDAQIDFEPSHPGLHLMWTMVHTICVLTITFASRHPLRTGQGIFMLLTVIVDNVLLVVTWWFLRYCRLTVARAIENEEINDIHPSSKRYLDFIPPADRDKEDCTARHLLWQTVHVFEDVRDHIEEISRNKSGEVSHPEKDE